MCVEALRVPCGGASGSASGDALGEVAGRLGGGVVARELPLESAGEVPREHLAGGRRGGVVWDEVSGEVGRGVR